MEKVLIYDLDTEEYELANIVDACQEFGTPAFDNNVAPI